MAAEATVVDVPNSYSFSSGSKLTAHTLDGTGHQFSCTGDEVCFFTSAAGGTATITSVADPFSRTGDVDIVLSAGEEYCWRSAQTGFMNASGKVVITLSAGTDVTMYVVRL